MLSILEYGTFAIVALDSDFKNSNCASGLLLGSFVFELGMLSDCIFDCTFFHPKNVGISKICEYVIGLSFSNLPGLLILAVVAKYLASAIQLSTVFRQINRYIAPSPGSALSGNVDI